MSQALATALAVPAARCVCMLHACMAELQLQSDATVNTYHSPARGEQGVRTTQGAVLRTTVKRRDTIFPAHATALAVPAARCVSMLAELYHSPAKGVDNAVGTSTLGSSEAIMLAGLAMKKRWQARMEAQGKPTTKPNLVMGYNVQVTV